MDADEPSAEDFFGPVSAASWPLSKGYFLTFRRVVLALDAFFHCGERIKLNSGSFEFLQIKNRIFDILNS